MPASVATARLVGALGAFSAGTAQAQAAPPATAPYNKAGFGGMKIESVYLDENGGATKQVQALRHWYDREMVDAVVGYVGSGDCLAVAPVAEEMKKFLIWYDCGTPARSAAAPATSTAAAASATSATSTTSTTATDGTRAVQS
jgi:ABC-type branched-subunit amino acid transport system substrate-binding protein